MLVVSPDLVTRFAGGEIWLHTLETVKALSFPNLWVMSVLFHFARPTDENAFLEKIKPDERAQVGDVLSQLKEVGALKTVSGNGAAPAPQSNDLPGALVDAGLRPLSEIIYRLAGTLTALSPEAAQAFETQTGQDIRARVEALIAGAASLELELNRFVPGYVQDQLRELGVEANARHLKIHIGAGQDRLPDWVNIDGYPAELALDVTRGLPFADGAADYVFMSHILEHLFYPDDALSLLREVQRVLAPGGRARIIVPDVEKCLRAYAEESKVFFNGRKETWHWWGDTNTRLEDFLAYAGAGPRPSSFFDSHKFGYDFETLSHILYKAGFTSVKRSDYMAAADPVLRVDDISRVAGAKYGNETYSLFVEAAVA